MALIPLYRLNASSCMIDLSKELVKSLQQKRMYLEDLMYRGVSVRDRRSIRSIREIGTDHVDQAPNFDPFEDEDDQALFKSYERDQVDFGQRIADIQELSDLSDMAKKETESDSFSAGIIWAFPQAGLRKCIDDYAFNGHGNVPLILVYDPRFLVCSYSGYVHDGKKPDSIPLKDKLVSAFARYKIVGATPKEACLAVVELVSGMDRF